VPEEQSQVVLFLDVKDVVGATQYTASFVTGHFLVVLLPPPIDSYLSTMDLLNIDPSGKVLRTQLKGLGIEFGIFPPWEEAVQLVVASQYLLNDIRFEGILGPEYFPNAHYVVEGDPGDFQDFHFEF
jgi:hypothetical protein